MGIRSCCVLVTVSLALGSGANAAAPDASEPWDLVWYSDSTGWGVADLWAAQIEEEFGVEVRVHDHAVGVLSAAEILASLREPTDGYTRLGDTRAEVAEADIVVIFGNPIDSGSSDDIGERCLTRDTTPREPPSRYSSDDLDPYRDVLVSVYERVAALVGDRPVIVRAIDSYNPVIADQALAGVAKECTAAWEAWSRTIQDAADASGVPMVSMYDLFNGPAHSDDPRLTGYVGSDGIHASSDGRTAMMTALHQAGYEPSAP